MSGVAGVEQMGLYGATTGEGGIAGHSESIRGESPLTADLPVEGTPIDQGVRQRTNGEERVASLFQEGSRYRVLHGDSLELLQGLPDNSIGAVVCDPPYGLCDGETQRKYLLEVISAWVRGEEFVPPTKGLGGEAWDAWVPAPKFWKEVYRVLKPGGYLLAASGDRTYDLMGLSIRMGGFQIRQGISWLYATGQERGLDVSVAIDALLGVERPLANPDVKLEDHVTRRTVPGSAAAKRFDGFKTLLKPSFEPFVLAQKPPEGGFAQNLLNWGVGALNINACRVPTKEGDALRARKTKSRSHLQLGHGAYGDVEDPDWTIGRFPANTVLSHSVQCTSEKCIEGCSYQTLAVMSPGQSFSGGGKGIGSKSPLGKGLKQSEPLPGYNDKGGPERYFNEVGWSQEDIDGEALRILLEVASEEGVDGREAEAGVGVMTPEERRAARLNALVGEVLSAWEARYLTEAARVHTEGVSHFFYTPKPHTNEKDEGISEEHAVVYEAQDGSGKVLQLKRVNHHVSVKPVSLAVWMVKAVTPPGEVVLDPFAGSGTTGVGALHAGDDIRVLLMEREERYLPLIEGRCRQAEWKAKRGLGIKPLREDKQVEERQSRLFG